MVEGHRGSLRVSEKSCDVAVSGFIYLRKYKTACQSQVFSWLPLKHFRSFFPSSGEQFAILSNVIGVCHFVYEHLEIQTFPRHLQNVWLSRCWFLTTTGPYFAGNEEICSLTVSLLLFNSSISSSCAGVQPLTVRPRCTRSLIIS